jgi:hypothetical protein
MLLQWVTLLKIAHLSSASATIVVNLVMSLQLVRRLALLLQNSVTPVVVLVIFRQSAPI